MFLPSLYFNLVKQLNSDATPGALAAGLCFGYLIGLMPVPGFFFFLWLMFLLVFNAAISLALLAFFLTLPLKYILNGFLNQIGENVLTAPGLQSFFSHFFSVPFSAATGLNNTLVMGTFLFSVVTGVIIWFVFRFLAKKYRQSFKEWFVATRFYKILDKFSLPAKIAKFFVR